MTRAVTMYRMARLDALATVAAVLISGLAAGRLISPALYVVTVLVAVLVFRGARGATDGDAPFNDGAFPPGRLSTRVGDALERTGDTDAHRLLVGVIAQARPPFIRARNQLDERETRDKVSSLVEACCATAESLAELDRAIGAAPPNAAASARAEEMRQRIVGQLTGVAARQAAAEELRGLRASSAGGAASR
jgi:hypothetical protein